MAGGEITSTVMNGSVAAIDKSLESVVGPAAKESAGEAMDVAADLATEHTLESSIHK